MVKRHELHINSNTTTNTYITIIDTERYAVKLLPMYLTFIFKVVLISLPFLLLFQYSLTCKCNFCGIATYLHLSTIH